MGSNRSGGRLRGCVRGGRVAMLLVAVIAPAAGSTRAAEPERFEFRAVRMGVPFTLTFYASDEPAATAAAAAAFARVKVLNNALSDYHPQSELNRLTRDAVPGAPYPVSPDLREVLAESLRFASLSDGAFDPTVGPVVRLWRRARRTGSLPPADELTSAVAAVGFRQVTVDAAAGTVTLDRPDVRLDLGGIAKGYACDAALAVLREHGLPQALVEAGGDLAIGDPPPGQPGWTIAVEPLTGSDTGSRPRFLTLANQGVATSGDLYQFVEIDGTRYSHLVDPHTGLGLTTRSSVTVIAPNATAADALASAVSVLGPLRGLDLIRRVEGAEALTVLLGTDNAPQEAASDGFAGFVSNRE